MSNSLVQAAAELRDAVNRLVFSEPIAYIYNPLDYAWAPHVRYLELHGAAPKKVVFLGMNPGPFGMAQTGVPFGEVAAIRDWVGVCEAVNKPKKEHPKRPIDGFDCPRSEVSGRRLWGLFAERFGKAEHFFKDHFVANYCPLVFAEESGRNYTPDKLLAEEAKRLFDVCDKHLRALVEATKPEWLVGVGVFAEGRAKEALEGLPIKIGKILHPSPASPVANRGWGEAATKQLQNLDIWS